MNFEHVYMYASNFEETKHFYIKTLNIPLINEDPLHFTLQFGQTAVTFIKSTGNEKPFYHFAFNIPANQFNEAKDWIKLKVNLLLENDEDEVYFKNIHAKSLYFEDPAGNIVEFICRFSDANDSNKPFSGLSIAKMSEMSVVVADKLVALPALQHINIHERSNKEIEAEGLTFMGEANDATFLLFVNEGRRWFFSHKQSKAYPLKVQLTNSSTIWIDENLQLNSFKK